MMPERDKRHVTVEDLLKVKRSERPDGEFWNGWQAEMRTRLVAAREEPRPWWKDAFHRVMIGIARRQMLVGTACVLILGVVVVRQSQSSFSPLPGELPASGVSLHQQSQAPDALPAVGSPSLLVMSASVDIAYADAPHTREASYAITRLDECERTSPAAQAIAANLATVEQVDPDLSPRYSFGDVFEVPSREALESAMRAARHNHIFGYAEAPAVTEEAATQVRRQDRLLSRLREDVVTEAAARSLSDSRGDRFNLRF